VGSCLSSTPESDHLYAKFQLYYLEWRLQDRKTAVIASKQTGKCGLQSGCGSLGHQCHQQFHIARKTFPIDYLRHKHVNETTQLVAMPYDCWKHSILHSCNIWLQRVSADSVGPRKYRLDIGKQAPSTQDV